MILPTKNTLPEKLHSPVTSMQSAYAARKHDVKKVRGIGGPNHVAGVRILSANIIANH